jgi:8-oxo-dGTP diphosphatase
MASSFTYKYPRPMVTVDLVVFALAENGLRSPFIRRKKDPFAGRWAIPGGYMEMEESIEAAARRELKEETGLDDLLLVEEIGVFGEPGRDPRGRTISIAHIGLVRGLPHVTGADDAAEAAWLNPLSTLGLAFDHDLIVEKARDWLARAVSRDEVAFALLPDPFTASDVERLFRAARGKAESGRRWLATRVNRGAVAAGSGPNALHRRA